MEMEWRLNGSGMETEWKWNGVRMEVEWRQNGDKEMFDLTLAASSGQVCTIIAIRAMLLGLRN